ncbi:MAG: lipid II flippase MurJ, partial [Acidimicrobiales bacterium]
EGIARALAWGVLVGGVLQLVVQLPAVRSLTPGLRLSLDRSSPEIRSVLSRFGTVVVGRGAVQLLTYVDLFLASLLAVGAVSALTYAQVLYLLPISLFGMAVAAAELPELSRLGREGADAIRERLAGGLERITFYVAITAALYVGAGDVIVGALLQRGEFDAADTRLVWFTLGAFALGLLGTTRSRLLQNGLYALDRPKLVARIAVVRVALAAILGALVMFPLDRLAIIGSSVQRVGDLGLSPLPDGLRLLDDGPPRLGIVGLALAAGLSSWVEYRLLRGALAWRIGRLPGLGHDARWSLIAAGAAGVLADAGLPVGAAVRGLSPDRLRRRLDDHADRAASRRAVLDAYDPGRQLARGWTLTRTATGRLVRDVAGLDPGDVLVTTFASGTTHSTVASVEENPRSG